MAGDPQRAERIEELAAQCLDRLAAEGAAVVAQVCAADPELIEPVRRVLRQLDNAGLTAPAPAAEPPRQLGEFRLLEKLGEGGMGVVWLAEQPRLHRKVALKLLRAGFDQDARVRERFRREVQALSKLDHPNICTVYEAGEIEDTLFLAMRFVEGQSLANVLAERRRVHTSTGASRHTTSSRELLELLHLIEKVARALHVAHEAGVVHRDVKPGNILIDRSGEPVLVDFGLARADDPALSALTLSGEPLGTPAYMAPEQVAAKGAPDRRTDVYALGATLYECVTLRPPFEARSRDSLYRSILHDPVRNPRGFNRGVGRELTAVLEKALEKSPRRRFDTALEFAEELRRIRQHEPIHTRSIGPLLRGVRWCQRNPAATAVLATVSAALALALVQLQHRVAAERHVRSLALLGVADGVAEVNPVLAFKLCREALFLERDPAAVDPQVVVRVQQAMFRLRANEVIREEDAILAGAGFSHDGDFLVVVGPRLSPTVHDRQGNELWRIPHTTYLAAFSPRRREIAVADDDRSGEVFLYDLDRNLDTPRVRVGHGDREQGVANIAWSPDGNRLVLALDDGSASVWTREGKPLGTLQSQDSSIGVGGQPWMRAAFLPDGRVVAAGAIWSPGLDTSIPLRSEDGRTPLAVRRIHCTDNRLITHGIEQGGVQLWNLAGGLEWESETVPGNRDFVYDTVRFDPDGERFAVGYANRRVELRKAEAGQLIDSFATSRHGGPMSLDFSPEGDRIVVAGSSGLVEIRDARRLDPVLLAGHQGHVHSVVFAPEGDRILSVASGGKALMWWPWLPFPGVQQIVGSATFPDLARSRDGIVLTMGDGRLLFCDIEGNVLRQARVPSGVCFVRLDRRGTTALITAHERSVFTWDLAVESEPRKVHELEQDRWPIASGFLEDGRILVLEGSLPRRIRVLDPRGGAPQVLDVGLGNPSCLVVTGSGREVLVSSGTGEWCLLSLQDGELVVRRPTVEGPDRYPVSCLAVSPDGKRFLAGTNRGQVYLWQIETGELLGEYPGHQHVVNTLDFSPDGRHAASSSKDGTVRVFDLEGREETLVIRAHEGYSIYRVKFLDERRLITTSMDGTVCWWWLDAKGLREAVQEIDIPELTREERADFAHLLDR